MVHKSQVDKAKPTQEKVFMKKKKQSNNLEVSLQSQ
jgi:hypothetical protein